ncbi:MAG: TIGR03619 family F420-dependent LLM class oxidoreductase [Pseudomonadales bacterium]|nr:TIGR03619 family F420-dependent LLM class oxidoreductase [Pseudomonadales bacterium]
MFLGFSSMNTPKDPDPAELAKTLEQAGFESLWYGEHSHIPRCLSTPYPAGGEMPQPYKEMMDPYLSLMAAASATSTLKLGTGIALLCERELFSQAKTIACLDRLSNGRVMIGTGVGWNKEELENVSHIPFNKRYKGLREIVEATRILFNEDAPEYHGEFIDFDPVWFEPKPTQTNTNTVGKCGPKFTLGVMGPLGLKHAAQWADGWMPVDVAMPDVEQGIIDFRAQVTECGRNPDDVEITMVVMNPAVDGDLLKRFRDMGVTRCNIGVGMENWDKPDSVYPMIEKFSKIIPQL